LRAEIDYGTSEAKTTYGIIGIKVWVFKGESMTRGESAMSLAERATEEPAKRAKRPGRNAAAVTESEVKSAARKPAKKSETAVQEINPEAGAAEAVKPQAKRVRKTSGVKTNAAGQEVKE
jgi:small subunit ribosomal protein S3